MLGSGREALEMAMESKPGLMGRNMWGSGEKTRLMERVDSYMWTGISMMGSGLTIRLMDTAFISM